MRYIDPDGRNPTVLGDMFKAIAAGNFQDAEALAHVNDAIETISSTDDKLNSTVLPKRTDDSIQSVDVQYVPYLSNSLADDIWGIFTGKDGPGPLERGPGPHAAGNPPTGGGGTPPLSRLSAKQIREKNKNLNASKKDPLSKDYVHTKKKPNNRAQTRAGGTQELQDKEGSIRAAHPENRTNKTQQRIDDEAMVEAQNVDNDTSQTDTGADTNTGPDSTDPPSGETPQ
jgi:hypothetical protein